MHISDVFQAKLTIQSIARSTPIFAARSLEQESGFELVLKAENLQKTGSFKIRGAANFLLKRSRMSLHTPGVVAASSGNHGQAVACVAGMLKIPAIIVMPSNATKAKVQAAMGYGAQVEFCGTTSSERLQRASELAEEHGYVQIPPYDHEDILAGQGTIGLEIIEQIPTAEVIYLPIGGGGLTAGVAFAVKQVRPDIRVIGVEPQDSNSMFISRQNGSRTALKTTRSFADGLLTLIPGELTFPLVEKYVDDIVLVSEEEICRAMRLCLERFKLLAEPSGAVSIAGAWRESRGSKQTAVAVLSGGNADLSRMGEYMSC